MKKIILTLGIILSAYSTYALNTNTGTKVAFEYTECTKTVYVYNERGQLMTIIYDQPCNSTEEQ